MRTFFAVAIAALCAELPSDPVLAADECGPLQRLTSVDTVMGPAGYMLVPVKMGDAQRLLLFDTGGAISGITQAAAAELHLPSYESRVRLIGVNGATSNRYTVIPSLTIGTAETKSVQYIILPNNMPALSRGGVAGALAPAPGVDIEVDFANNKLSFFSTSHCEGKVVYWPADTVAVVPMRVAGNDPGGLRTEHIIVPVTLDGKLVDALVDTGAASNVLNLRVARDRFGVDLSAPDVRQVGQLGNNASAKIYRKQFGTLSFEGVTVSNPVLDLVPDEVTRATGNSPPTGSLVRPSDKGLPDLILGMPVLSKTHIYVAYRERKLYITQAGGGMPLQASITRPVAPGASVSGPWKITVQVPNGPAPVCEIVQMDTDLTGTCTGPVAKGELTGTVAGQAVRWQWKRVANANGATTLWNFSGTLTSGNAISGFVQQAGRTAAFTATRQ